MKIKLSLAAICFAFFLPCLFAQDLGPHFKKIKEGIYIESTPATGRVNSNCGIIVSTEGIILVDSGHTAIDSREVEEAVKKLSPLPVRFVIDTETHPDHTWGHHLFSPPAIIINHEGAGIEMRESFDQERINTQAKQSPEMAKAQEGFHLITPQIEYGGEKMILHVGERTLELLSLGPTHSKANTAVWLPSERVLFASSVALPDPVGNIPPFANIPSIIGAIKVMKALSPEIVIPGHGLPGTTDIFDNKVRYLALLQERVAALMNRGKSLNEIKQELKMPEYEDAVGAKERISNNAEAAYRTIQSHDKP